MNTTTNPDTYTVHTVTVPVTTTVTIEVTGARDAEHARQLATAAANERTWLDHMPPMAGEWPLVEIMRIDGPTGKCQFGAPHDYGQHCECAECADAQDAGAEANTCTYCADCGGATNADPADPDGPAFTCRCGVRNSLRNATWQEWMILVGVVLVGIIGTVLAVADYTGRV